VTTEGGIVNEAADRIDRAVGTDPTGNDFCKEE
jgi:hypothetical protein